jgi:hypothetical protein
MSAIRNTAALRDFEVIPSKFNAYRTCTQVISSSVKLNNSNNRNGYVGLEICAIAE